MCGVKERISAPFLGNWFHRFYVITYFVTYFNSHIYYVFRVSTFIRKRIAHRTERGEPITSPCIPELLHSLSEFHFRTVIVLPNYAWFNTVLIIKYSELWKTACGEWFASKFSFFVWARNWKGEDLKLHNMWHKVLCQIVSQFLIGAQEWACACYHQFPIQ